MVAMPIIITSYIVGAIQFRVADGCYVDQIGISIAVGLVSIRCTKLKLDSPVVYQIEIGQPGGDLLND